ncbi:peptidase [Corallococcus sp. AB045]|uniref:dipeptidyl-peptidase 3 family protein n=1 Tax=Corallococcus sp. AB045 TaxID=2316719 RepID=UPI000EE72D4F|nr:peptidase [Corallococcus sp. AB045]RKH76312.1 peptidase [Corallococcus sp. AB045]
MKPLLLAAVLAAAPATPQKSPAPDAGLTQAAQPSLTVPGGKFLRARSGNTAVAQMFAPGIAELSLAEKRVAWSLTLAAHAGEDIALDQLGWKLVPAKQLLEGVWLFGRDAQSAASGFDGKLADYLLRFYGHGGNHDSTTGQKFVPAFTAEQLAAGASRALKAGAPWTVKDEAALQAWLQDLTPTLFDASFEPQLTSKAPPPGQDLLTASSNTAYGPGVTEKDLVGFKEKYPLNSRVVKQDGKLTEQVFRAGTPDGKVKPGLYAKELSRVIAHLQEAMKSAEPAQKAALGKLVRYFQTGSPKDWDAYNIAWLKVDPKVDANLGFIETYVDPRGHKGQWEGLVNYRDTAENQIMVLMGQKAQYFEDRLPWPQKYRRKKVSPPVAKAINLITSNPEPPAGINLPNEQHIREKYGSKSVMITNVMDAASAVTRLPLALEFSRTAEDREQAQKYSVTARKWLVAFHEVLGHASGQVDPKLKGQSPSVFLKEYDNTLEEARADLIALWHAFDPALAELSPDHEAIARQMYRDFLVEGLTNLRRVETGNAFEEDHQRGHHMTVTFLEEKGAVKQVTENGRTYLTVPDYAKMREAVGELLSKLMVIKATGDYEGIRALVQEKGIHFDPKLRDEVARRVKAVDVPTVLLLNSPRVIPVLDAKGALVDLKEDTTQAFVDQHLERSLLGRLSPSEASRVAAKVAGSPDAVREAFKELGPDTAPAPTPAKKGAAPVKSTP